MDAGFPLFIADGWPGMANAGFAIGIDACFDVVGGRELLLPAAETIRCPVGGTRFRDLPWRGVLHTTEGGSIQSNVETYKAGGDIFPHLTIDPRTLGVAQHFSLNAGCRALDNRATPANASNAIQIEESVPTPRASGRQFLRFHISAADDASTRMSVDGWQRFSGWCGHQHVPGNSHGDPGAIDIDFLLAN